MSQTCSDFGHGASCEARAASIAGQQGEREAVQLVLHHRADLTGVTVSVSGIPSDVATFAAFQVGYVNTTDSPRYEGSGGGFRPDPLLPFPTDGQGVDVPAGVAQALWITAELGRPGAARAGNYTGTITVSNSAGKALTVPLTVELWALALPTLAESAIGTAWSGVWSPPSFSPYYPAVATDAQKWNATKSAFYDTMFDARMPADSIYITTPRNVSDYEDLAARGAQWFALLDVSSLPLTPGGAPVAPRPRGAGVGTRVGGSCHNYTKEYVARMLATLEPIVTALEAKGLLDKAYIYGFDECPVSCEPQVRKLFGATKAKWPALRTAAVLNWHPMPVDLPVDVWILQYEEYDAANAASWAASQNSSRGWMSGRSTKLLRFLRLCGSMQW